MHFLIRCCIRGVADADARLWKTQIPKDDEDYLYKPPDDRRRESGPRETCGEAWWPEELKELYDTRDDEFYIGRLTFLSINHAYHTGDLAIEYIGEDYTRRWKWISADAQTLRARLVKESEEEEEEEEELHFSTFCQRYINEFMDQLRCNEQHFQEKLVNGAYISSPELSHQSSDEDE